MNARFFMLDAQAFVPRGQVPDDGALFAHVLAGGLQLRFAGGRSERLNVGDSIHVTKDLPIDWINPFAGRGLFLCIADRRSSDPSPDGQFK
jgi:hypothetical protein